MHFIPGRNVCFLAFHLKFILQVAHKNTIILLKCVALTKRAGIISGAKLQGINHRNEKKRIYGTFTTAFFLFSVSILTSYLYIMLFI